MSLPAPMVAPPLCGVLYLDRWKLPTEEICMFVLEILIVPLDSLKWRICSLNFVFWAKNFQSK